MAVRTAQKPTVPSRGASVPRVITRPAGASDHTASRMVLRPVAVPNRRLATHLFGEAFLTWRCGDCGHLGPLSALPTACPDCGAAREALYYELED